MDCGICGEGVEPDSFYDNICDRCAEEAGWMEDAKIGDENAP